MTEQVAVQTEEGKPVPSFLKDKHELAKLMKELDKASSSALATLIKVMTETKDEKLKAGCAKDILAFYTATAKQISDDDMARLIAEVKLGGGKKAGMVLPPGEVKPATPSLDFEHIKAV